jgi:hypothetical protein
MPPLHASLVGPLDTRAQAREESYTIIATAAYSVKAFASPPLPRSSGSRGLLILLPSHQKCVRFVKIWMY